MIGDDVGALKAIHKLENAIKREETRGGFTFRICLSDDDLERNEGHSTCK